jgi:hypothetical protein
MFENTPEFNEESAHSLMRRAGHRSEDWLNTHLPPVRETLTGRLALGLSALLHPLLLPSYLFSLLFWLSPSMMGVSNDEIRNKILILLVVCTFLIPMLSTYMLYRLGSIKSLHMEDRQDRIFPFISTTLFYGLTTYLFLKQLSSLYLIAVIVGFLTGLYYHYAAIEFFYPLLIVILLAGLLMSARLYLNAHTPAQVLAGAAVGLGIGLGTILIFA